jgi:hypothetical protein
MPQWKQVLTGLGLGEHAEFIWNVLDWFGLTKPVNWIFYGAGGGVSGYFASLANWSAVEIFLAVIGAGAGLSVAYAGLHYVATHPRPKNGLPSEQHRQIEVAASPAEPDITASDAYLQILEHSEWTLEQRRITTDTTHLRRDWLEFRLDKEIHRALRNSELEAWGEECLHGMVTTPLKPISAVTWDTVEISFYQCPQFTRTAAYQKGPTTFRHGRQAWIDVKFSSRQIFTMFPLASSNEWKPIHIAIEHVSNRIGDADQSGCFPEARRLLRQRAYDQKVKLRGRKQLVDRPLFRKDEYSEIHTDIDPRYWTTSEINALATSTEPKFQADYHTDPQTAYAWGPKGLDERNRYAQLFVNWADILREWPQ